ncbi:isoprenoid synthase domain-containing protein [Roridomyces roridus]|uniref:Isoprenoid synthase domain-containing protein n=1 Tax=Roridomyces roridus TaxID=1738132 RepID=A0AAD7B4C8_9AGAR|nr:isoprenoid synthase domain-containing protein [Roridomyces roridus]
MPTPSDYTTCIQRLLTDIGYRYEPFPPYDTQYWGPFHNWSIHALGPTLSYTTPQLAAMEQCAGRLIERAYPHTQTSLKLVFAKLTAIVIAIDDAIEDDGMNDEIAHFSHRLYMGQTQPAGTLLALYHDSLKELSGMFGDDAVLRDAAVVPWINFIDACLIEKQIFTALREKDTDGTYLDGAAEKFPQYLRNKSGVAEAYAAAAFASKTSKPFPLDKYVRAFPDFNFYINVMNDVLSFHKEELVGEKYNLIHLRTRSLISTGARGTGPEGEWTPFDTFVMLCDELRAATRRIDEILRLDECERKVEMRGESGIDQYEEEIEIAKRWRGFRDGYVSWHIESSRYKLGFMQSWATSRAGEF